MTRLAGGVLCGGASSRFGSDKALAPAGDGPLGALVVTALRDAGIDPVVALGGSAGHQLGIPVVPDRAPGDGPLAALASALTWAGAGWLLVSPCDLPLLTANHVELLVGDLVGDRARVAVVDGSPQPSLAVWPASWARRTQKAVDQGERAFRHALTLGEWDPVRLPAEALADADTREELDRLLDSPGGQATTA